MSNVTLPLVDGTRVVVPDSLNLITPYVLREQQDWFEDEIKFLRKLLRPGQQVIDIGANYGLYAMSMAKAVGAQGRLWAFEPASATAAFLSQSIAANGFSHITLEKSALSSQPGKAHLSLNANSELNELVRNGNNPSGQSEEVELTTLDLCLERFGWQDITFMKIDAEGEEANILKGGQEFFSRLSPLIEYEVKAGAELHLELTEAFAVLGYRSYRLVPGLDLLVPFQPADTPDAYLLNLFCCKPERAAELAAQGFLLDSVPALPDSAPAQYHWRQALLGQPYAKPFQAMWESSVKSADFAELETALAWFACSQDSSQAPGLRFAALQASFAGLHGLCEKNPVRMRRASLAAAATAYGARSIAVDALAKLGNTLLTQKTADPAEPFLVPCARYATLNAGAQLGNWLFSAVLEALEQLSSFSSFYSGSSALQRLEILCSQGFASAEMQRRRELVRQRFGVK